MASQSPVHDEQKLLWYFAYGSNMSTAKFTGGRGIKPLKAARVRTPGWVLALDIPGLPYSEPTFTSLLRRHAALAASGAAERLPGRSDGRSFEKPRRPAETDRSALSKDTSRDAIGVAYLINELQYARVIGSEGGGTAYTDVEVLAEPVDCTDAGITGGNITVRTLISATRREPWPKPSKRYMSIVTDGAMEANLPLDYQIYLQSIATYELPRSSRGRAGAAIFVGFWGPIMGLLEKITTATLRADGYCPLFVIWIVRLTMYLIWFTHDAFFAPLFGRGDGHDESNGEGMSARVLSEETWLLEKRMHLPSDLV